MTCTLHACRLCLHKCGLMNGEGVGGLWKIGSGDRVNAFLLCARVWWDPAPR